VSSAFLASSVLHYVALAAREDRRARGVEAVGMHPLLRRQIRNIALVGLGAFIVINGCSWRPGSGGRHDRKPGMEVERYFGWPACFYADLWRSDEPMNVEPWDYAPPFPISRQMYFVYHRARAVPLLLDAVLVVAVTAGVVILRTWEFHGRSTRRSVAVLVALVVVAWSIVRFGDATSVYL
jgi:hypothetical protein